MTKTATQNRRLLIVDDHAMVAEGIASVLKKSHPHSNIITAMTGSKAIEAAQNQEIDVAIVDVSLPDIDGLTLIKELRRVQTDIRIVVYTIHDEPWVVREMLCAGAKAVVLKSDDTSELILAIESVCAGMRYFSTRFNTAIENLDHDFTPRDIEILQHIRDGETSGDIAKQLFVSENTVEYHRHKLMNRLQATNNAHMIAVAIRQGLIRA